MISIAPAAQQALKEWLAVKVSVEAKSEKTAQALTHTTNQKSLILA